MSRRLMLRNASGDVEPVLPSEYQRVEWIAGASQPYIDIGRLTDESVRIKCKAMCTNAGRYGRVAFAAMHAAQLVTSGVSLYVETSGKIIFRSGSTVFSVADVNSLNKAFEGDFYISGGGISNAEWSSSVTIDGTEYAYSGTGESRTYSDDDFCIFGNYNRNGELAFYGRFYYAKVWNGGTPFADLMPCYRKSDGVVGMYDFVSDLFRTAPSISGGTFTKGADVN